MRSKWLVLVSAVAMATGICMFNVFNIRVALEGILSSTPVRRVERSAVTIPVISWTTSSPSSPELSDLNDWYKDYIESGKIASNPTPDSVNADPLSTLEDLLTRFNTSTTFRRANMGVMVRQLPKDSFAGMVMSVAASNDIIVDTSPAQTSNATLSDALVEIIVPSSLKKRCKRQNIIPFNLAVVKTLDLYRNIGIAGSVLSDNVVCMSVSNEDIQNLTEPVTARFAIRDNQSSLYQHLKPDKYKQSKVNCVWWEPLTRSWSTAGCHTSIHSVQNQSSLTLSEGFRVECQCDHFTSFALMMTPTKANSRYLYLTEAHFESLKILTSVGVGLSILALAIAVLMFLCNKSLRKRQNQYILFQLSLSMLIFLVAYLVAALAELKNAACKAAGVFLHYTMLVMFAWMLVQSIHMYLSLVKVFNTYIPRFMLKASISSWVVPVVFPIIVLIVDGATGSNSYQHPSEFDSCFLNGKFFYITLLGPISIVILVNISLFVRSMWALKAVSPMRMSTKKAAGLSFLIKTGIVLSVLLGSNWILAWPLSLIMESYVQEAEDGGAAAKEIAYLVFAYASNLMNSVQGLLIVIIHYLRPAMKKSKVWTRLCSRLGGRSIDRHSSSTSSATLHANTTSSMKLSELDTL